MKQDIFRPNTHPAQEIYDAFMEESLKRNSRSIQEWQELERYAVLHAATSAAVKYKLREPTMGDVMVAEILAMGHVDYGAKWAYGVVDRMQIK